ncbi:GNAT family N-acetyltransferase [Aspergillus lucknowensis]|uniref:Acyl-CoA N-acyltransferase n=1 Tax=Aspergillus lucknowensis TaxID=176173 RepID=A0ABR4M7M6_9EURO
MPLDQSRDPRDPFRSQRLVYRAIEDSDADKSFFHTHLNDPAMHFFSSTILPRPRTQKSAAEFLAIHQERLLSVMICLPETEPDTEESSSQDTKKERGRAGGGGAGQPIGRLSLSNPLGSLTAHHRNAVMGISLIAEARGKGYGGEAINWALDWAFEIAGLHRVGIQVCAFNEGALGLYRKVGFVEEGREREAVWHGREWHDVVSLGILEGEWARLRARSLAN